VCDDERGGCATFDTLCSLHFSTNDTEFKIGAGFSIRGTCHDKKGSRASPPKKETAARGRRLPTGWAKSAAEPVASHLNVNAISPLPCA
jgi:hypothetical protein